MVEAQAVFLANLFPFAVTRDQNILYPVKLFAGVPEQVDLAARSVILMSRASFGGNPEHGNPNG